MPEIKTNILVAQAGDAVTLGATSEEYDAEKGQLVIKEARVVETFRKSLSECDYQISCWTQNRTQADEQLAFWQEKRERLIALAPVPAEPEPNPGDEIP